MTLTASHPDRMPPLLTPAEVATILRVTPRTVRRWSASGRLQPVRLGRLTRYSADSVRALIQTTDAAGARGGVEEVRDHDAQPTRV